MSVKAFISSKLSGFTYFRITEVFLGISAPGFVVVRLYNKLTLLAFFGVSRDTFKLHMLLPLCLLSGAL
jgi:hypothetical protein